MTRKATGMLPLNLPELEDLRGYREFNTLDLYLAAFLLSQATRPTPELAWAVALASQATREGHVCLGLGAIAGRRLETSSETHSVLPTLERWCEVLESSGVVGRPGAYQPLILDEQKRLYLHRYWTYEQRLAKALLSRSQQSPDRLDRQQLRDDLGRLFPESGVGSNGQKIAAATALLQGFSVIAGGPGTGKTTTVVRLLALLKQQPGGESLRIALAAPTGMAAARMQQAIRNAKQHLPLERQRIDTLPETATTLHRLLGVQQQGTGFYYHRRHRLPVDVLILDEASMVDVALMAKLMEALPESARLILLGDHHQLASVEAGAVLGEMCDGCNGPDGEFAGELAAVTGEPEIPVLPSDNRLHNHVVVLRHSYRFGDTSPIGRLAQAVKTGAADVACRLLDGAQGEGGLNWLSGTSQGVDHVVEHFRALTESIHEGSPVTQLFEKLHEFRVLCALREGPSGVVNINRLITRRLAEAGLIPGYQDWYPGRPVMITRNDYQLNLYNGETGLVLPHPDQPGELAVAFAGADQVLRWVNPARLPHCETVYAVTVHKSQGSEYAHVLLYLPERDSPVLSRELLYTAITRARQGFSLAGSESVFKTAVERTMQRTSGLQDRLREFSEIY